MPSTSIHPTAFIGDGVELGEGVVIGPGAVLLGHARIGDRAWIGPGAAIGGPPEIATLPQLAAWDGELAYAGVVLGADVVIREHVVIHQGSQRPTTVGASSWVLNRAYLAHDVELGAESTVSAGVSIGGHCSLGGGVNLGMNAVVHQRRIIGAGAMVGMGSAVTADVPPFAKVYGVPARLGGANEYGMRRRGLSESLIESVVRSFDEGDVELVAGGPVLEEIAEELAWWRAFESRRPVKVSGQGGGADV